MSASETSLVSMVEPPMMSAKWDVITRGVLSCRADGVGVGSGAAGGGDVFLSPQSGSFLPDCPAAASEMKRIQRPRSDELRSLEPATAPDEKCRTFIRILR